MTIQQSKRAKPKRTDLFKALVLLLILTPGAIAQQPTAQLESAPSGAQTEGQKDQPSAEAQRQPSTEPSISANDQIVLDREDLRMRFTQVGGCIEDIELKGFKEALKAEKNAQVTGGHFPCRALAIKVGEFELKNTPAQIFRPSEGAVEIIQNHEQLEFKKSVKLAQPFASELTLTVKNNGSSPWNGVVSIDLGGVSELKDAGSLFGGHALEYREATYLYEENVKRTSLPFEETPAKEIVEEKKGFLPEWVAANSLYFAFVLLPKNQDLYDFSVSRTGFNSSASRTLAADRTLYEVLLSSRINDLQPGATKTFEFDIYSGPKSKNALETFKLKKLQKNIDYGFFSVVAWPLYYFLKWCHDVSGNWGIAIILLTLVLKIILFPLTEKAFVAGKKMQKIQPELNALKEKYKDDRQAQQREMMSIMSQKGVNPMSGCLPILPQLPIFFGLNAVLLHTFELRHAHFAGWLIDLTARDPLYVTPALMAVLMYVQQKMTPMPTSMDPAQQKMMQFLPVIFAVFMLAYPSGLVLYIITNTVLSLLQQQYMMKKYKDA